jgi:sec-independent protein translocase protein TatA
MGLGLENPLHILMLLVVVLLVFGAKRLPEMGRGLGRGLHEFKQSVTGHETEALASNEGGAVTASEAHVVSPVETPVETAPQIQ